VALPFGLLLGFLMIRMGDLYVALVTLTFGLLIETLVFSRELFQNDGIGINVTRPHLFAGDRIFAWFALAVFAVVALITVNLRNSTTGLALGAVRSSEMAAKTIGISALRMKVLLGGLAAFVAGIGGAMLALSLGVALASNYEVLVGVIWLTVLVTQGIRFNTIALTAGLAQTLVAGVALVYLPKVFGNVVPVFFGLGAIAIVRFPEGIFTFQARQFRAVGAGLRERTPRLYDRFKLASFGYAVAFLVLVFAVRSLWWLWLAITFFVFNLVFGYLLRKQQKHEKREGKHEAVPVSAPPSFIPADPARTDFMAPH